MPPPPQRESAGCLKTALQHFLVFSLFGFFGYLFFGPEAIGLLFLAYVAGLSGLAFLRVFGRAEKK